MAMGKVPGSGDDELSGDGVFSEINITPLTDIFLVLLIIFMVTSSVIAQNAGGGARAGMKVNLPKGGAADVTAKASDLPVAVLADGRLVVGSDVVTSDELKLALQKAREKDPDTVVVIQADEGVAHGKVVQVMELAKEAGLPHLAIGVREGPK